MADILGKIKKKGKLFFKKVKKTGKKLKKRAKKLSRKQIIFIVFLLFFLLAAGDWLTKGGADIFKSIKFTRSDKFTSRTFTIHKDQKALEPASLEELILGPLLKEGERQATIGERLGVRGKSHSVSPEDDLQAVINESEDYDVIYLSRGTYSVNLFINKKLRIIGQGEGTILKAANEKNAVIKVRNAGLGLEDMVLADSYAGVDAGSAEVFVSNSRFRNISATAMYVKDSQLEFKNNVIDSCGEAIKALRSSGSIRNSVIISSAKSGIRLIKSNLIIEYNKITDNQSYGVYVDEDSEAQIRYNYIKDNEGYNVRIQKTRDIYK
ncbi:MAG: right-handed parallel beta-helix repeat-containing protein [Patescibacteria group bacterium]|nr:right-handed parallel beta-helix repeat-containing protein [Patescibacteria group bacterium]MDD5554884.1 right-handed parallel beta-helix repeat-containing protein [Patescibacteria group bacterium]